MARASSASNSRIAHTVTPEGFQRLLGQRELVQQLRLYPFAGLVAVEQLVAERFDDLIGGRRHMGYPVLPEQAEGCFDYAVDCAHFHTVGRPALGETEVGSEELVGSIEQVEIHVDDSREDNRPEAFWEQLSTGFAELGDLMRSGLTDLQDRDGPAREELRQAWGDFASASQRLGLALARDRSRPPSYGLGAKQAFGSIVDVVGTTVRNAAARTRQDLEKDHGSEDGEAAADRAV